jgi:uncharacterized protein (DUF433 family)
MAEAKTDLAPSEILERMIAFGTKPFAIPKEEVTNKRKSLIFAPAYEVSEAARYLHLPQRTLANWAGKGQVRVLEMASNRHLSFATLIDAHLISSMRRAPYVIPLQRIRKALDVLRKETGKPHPLIGVEFKTDGKDLFIEAIESDKSSKEMHLINLSTGGQKSMREVLDLYLSRISYQADVADVFYPFTSKEISEDEGKIVAISPRIGFGRPVIASTGVRTSAIIDRFRRGESIKSLSRDFGSDEHEIEVAIRLAA